MFALTYPLAHVHMAKKNISDFPPCGKMASARNFKNIFSRPLFTVIFSPKILVLDTDSILKVKTIYESVK